MKEKLEEYLNRYLLPEKEVKSESFFGAGMCFSKAKMKVEENFQRSMSAQACEEICDKEDISSFIQNNKEEDTFQSKLLKWIDKKNLKDSDVYNKVNIDRRLFSKIRSNKDYHPSKETIILLGLSLELSEKEIEELLESASYSLPMNNEFDLIIRFCFKEGIYNLFQINEFLEDHNCKVLG